MTAPRELTAEQRADAERWQSAMAKTMQVFMRPLGAVSQMAERSAAITLDLRAWLQKYGGAQPWMDWVEAEVEALATSEADIRQKARAPVAVPQDEPIAEPAKVILKGRPKTGPPGRENAATPARRGALQNGLGGETKNRRLSNKTESKTQAPQALYRGRDLAGWIRGTEALDLAGNSLGTFRTRTAAVGAVLAAAASRKEAASC
jgi:hypothetical protein